MDSRIRVALLAALIATGSSMAPLAHAAPQATPVNLGVAAPYTILAETTVSNSGDSTISGNVGLSPANASQFFGFNQALDSSGVFAKSPYVAGELLANSYKPPTPAELLNAVSAMRNALASASGEKTTYSEGTDALSGEELGPGVYTWSENLAMIGSIELVGGSNDTWVFQIPGTLAVSENVTVSITGGATYQNVYWVILGQTDIGKNDNFQGIILAENDILVNSGADITGKLYAQGGIAIYSSVINAPQTTTTSTSSTVAEFPQTSLALVAIAVFAAVGVFSRSSNRLRAP